MNERRLRSWCRRLLRELDIRPPLDVHLLCHRIAEHRGRPIRLVEWPLKVPGPFGLTFAADLDGGRGDVIAYQRETSRWHQDHIILHELGHILAGHGDDDEVGRRRTCYDSPHEREAELIATIIMEWAAALDGPGAPSTPEARDLHTSLSYRVGWL